MVTNVGLTVRGLQAFIAIIIVSYCRIGVLDRPREQAQPGSMTRVHHPATLTQETLDATDSAFVTPDNRLAFILTQMEPAALRSRIQIQGVNLAGAGVGIAMQAAKTETDLKELILELDALSHPKPE
jgi:hypothetical protein